MQNQNRLHALDAVRAFALLLGVFFHGAISFLAPTLAIGYTFIGAMLNGRKYSRSEANSSHGALPVALGD